MDSSGCQDGVADGNDSEDAFVANADADEIIDVDGDDKAVAAEEFDELELGEEMEDMDEGAVEDIEDDSINVFSKHTDSVLCVCVDPNTSQLAVTGGQDDVAYVWSLTSGNVEFKCTGHKDSVHCVGFSYDSLLIATGDMLGNIKVWNKDTHEEMFSDSIPVEETDVEEQDEKEKEDLMWLEWHCSKHDLLAGTKCGDVYMWSNISSSASCQVLSGHGSPCTAGRFIPDGQHAITGYEDGTIKFWNLAGNKCVHTFFGGKLGHASQVTCIDCHKNNNVVISGSTDASALLLNVKSGKVLKQFNCGDTSRGDSVETVRFSPCGRYIATATINDRDVADESNFGMLTLWDAEKFGLRHKCRHETGITRLCWDVKSPIVYTASEDGTVCSWDARNGNMLSTWHGHSDVILDLFLSRDGKTMVTASDDHTARVFSLETLPSKH